MSENILDLPFAAAALPGISVPGYYWSPPSSSTCDTSARACRSLPGWPRRSRPWTSDTATRSPGAYPRTSPGRQSVSRIIECRGSDASNA